MDLFPRVDGRSTVSERFEAKINKDGPIPIHCPEIGPCHLWTATTNGNGYGQLMVRRANGKNNAMAAHRLSWMLSREEESIPEGLNVLHRCDNPACVNPEHLFLGTQVDNGVDRRKKRKSRPSRGNKHYGAKLTWEIVRECRRLWHEGVPAVTLARRYGVKPTTIESAIHGRSWRVEGSETAMREALNRIALLGGEAAEIAREALFGEIEDVA